jgi:hypothetical protein
MVEFSPGLPNHGAFFFLTNQQGSCWNQYLDRSRACYHLRIISRIDRPFSLCVGGHEAFEHGDNQSAAVIQPFRYVVQIHISRPGIGASSFEQIW